MALRGLTISLCCLMALAACSDSLDTPEQTPSESVTAPAPTATPAPEIPNIIVELPEEQSDDEETDDSSSPAS